MAKKSASDAQDWRVSTGNIFEDLGIPDADIHDLKAQLAVRLNRAMAAQCCPQAEIARMLGIKQPQVSQLMNYKLQGFSAERLMIFLMKLGHAVDVRISDDPVAKPAVCVSSQEQEHVAIAALMGDLYESFTQAWLEVNSPRGILPVHSGSDEVKVVDALGRRLHASQDDSAVREKMIATFTPQSRTLQ